MTRPIRAVILAAAAVPILFGTAACVTNTESDHPEGWYAVHPEPVPEIIAMLPEEVREQGTLSVGTFPPFAPAEYKNSEGEIIGSDIDLAQGVADVLDLQLVVREQDFAMILPSITAGTLDFGASGFTDNEERRKRFDFVNYQEAGLQWATQPDNDITPDTACGRTVSVQRSTVSHTDDLPARNQACLDAGLPEINVLAYPDGGTAATAVVLGRADAMSADSPITQWAVTRSDDQLVTTGEVFDGALYGWPVPKNSDLAPALAAALQHLIDDGYYEEILQMWGLEEGALPVATINGEDPR